ncbi:MAG: type I secretion system permease/ATPase, partial [Hyphomicrobium sp.]
MGSSAFFRSLIGLGLLEIACLDLISPGWPSLLPSSLSSHFYESTAWLFAAVLALIGFSLVFTAWHPSLSSASSRGFYDFEILDTRAARRGGLFSFTLRLTSGLLLTAGGCLELYKSGWSALQPELFGQFFQKFPIANATAAAFVLAGCALIINAFNLINKVPQPVIIPRGSRARVHRITAANQDDEDGFQPAAEEAANLASRLKGSLGPMVSGLGQQPRSNDPNFNLSKVDNNGEVPNSFSILEEGIKRAGAGLGQTLKNSGPPIKTLGREALGAARTGFSLFGGLVSRLSKRKDKTQNAPEGGPPQPPVKGGTELSHTFSRCKGAFLAVGVFSAFSNVLTLTGSFYMLEVYDRVVPSRSVPTLVVLSVVALMLMAVQGGLDFIRSRILIRASNVFEDRLGLRVFDITTRVATTLTRRGNGLQPIRDLDAIKAFLSSGGPGALMDLPWLPFYMAIIFMFHWVLGVTAVVGALILVGLTILTEIKSHKPIKQTNERVAERAELALAGRRNAEVLASLGMKGRIAERYRRAGVKLAEFQTQSSDVSGGLGSISKTLRMVLQSAMLGIGALLVIAGEASSGIIIAGSILSGRALAPVDQAIANWKLFVAARQGWKRLREAFEKLPAEPDRMSLPQPKTNLKVENLLVLEPGGQRPILRDINFELKAGQSLCIIGPSGSGKSTLARSLVKAWTPAAGRVRIDGASLDQWPSDELGAHLGYLPQDVELFSGTIADNIARLEDKIESEAVIEAAQAAGAHQLILTFKDGYQTEIGEGGAVLSAGQRQRVALARALYKKPFVVVLDEPNSNLDAEGDKALLGAIEGVKKRNGIIIVISHRPSVLQAFDLVMIMAEGRAMAFGPRDEVLAKYSAAAAGRGPAPATGPVPTSLIPAQGPIPAVGGGRPPAAAA